MTVDSPTVGRGSAPTANPVELVVAGAAGRMGTRIVALAREPSDLRVVAALETAGHPALGGDAGELAGGGRLGVTIGADAAPPSPARASSSSSRCRRRASSTCDWWPRPARAR